MNFPLSVIGTIPSKRLGPGYQHGIATLTVHFATRRDVVT